MQPSYPTGGLCLAALPSCKPALLGGLQPHLEQETPQYPGTLNLISTSPVGSNLKNNPETTLSQGFHSLPGICWKCKKNSVSFAYWVTIQHKSKTTPTQQFHADADMHLGQDMTLQQPEATGQNSNPPSPLSEIYLPDRPKPLHKKSFAFPSNSASCLTLWLIGQWRLRCSPDVVSRY